MKRITPEIFREYDIRGVVESDLDSETCVLLGRGLGTTLARAGARSVAVGRDVRVSSDRIRDDFAQGLTSTGLDVVDVGVVPTPVLYYALYTEDVGGGVMITGSHNPPEYNGFKT